MSSPGLSLVGFLDDEHAVLRHLQNACIPKKNDQSALIAEWHSAKAQLGDRIENAGHPRCEPLPRAQENHAKAILSNSAFQDEWKGSRIELVEIDPLLAYQVAIDNAICARHCATLSQPPTLDQLMAVCLPLNITPEVPETFTGQNSLILRAKNLNVHIQKEVRFASFMGVQLGIAMPYVHVVRHGGRCYLVDGYHRAVGLRKAGATHAPCVLRDVPDHSAVGLNPPVYFPLDLLESDNPPTLGHFTQGRAYPVVLRSHSRIVHVSWAEHVVPDE